MSEENKELKELLKWSLKLQENESSLGKPMNPEVWELRLNRLSDQVKRMQFLKDALADIYSQPSETDLLKAALLILKVNYESSLRQASYEPSQLEEAFEQVQYLIEDLDHANDLQPLGGVTILLQYLTHDNHKLIELSCGAIASACQNNIKCQETFHSGLPQLLVLVKDVSVSRTARTKALAAVSSLARDFPPGRKAFFAHGGLSSLVGSLDSGFDKLTAKALFLLSYFYRSGSEEDLSVFCCDVLVQCTRILSASMDPQVVAHAISLLNATICNHGNQYQQWREIHTELFDQLRTSVAQKYKQFELHSEEEALSLMSSLTIKL